MKAICVYTESGGTARLISKYRPQAPVYAFSPIERVRARLHLMWGVKPMHCEPARNTEEMVAQAERLLLKRQAVQPKDAIAIVAGTSSSTGSTNFMRLHLVGGKEIGSSVNPSRR